MNNEWCIMNYFVPLHPLFKKQAGESGAFDDVKHG